MITDPSVIIATQVFLCEDHSANLIDHVTRIRITRFRGEFRADFDEGSGHIDNHALGGDTYDECLSAAIATCLQNITVETMRDLTGIEPE